MILNKIYVDNIIKTALLEDINYCDVTTDYLIPAEQNGNLFQRLTALCAVRKSL